MLPFLKDKKMSGAILETRRSPDSAKPEKEEPEGDNEALEACAEDILRAIASKDAKHLALALQAAYDICESSEPKEEEPASKHDYADQA